MFSSHPANARAPRDNSVKWSQWLPYWFEKLSQIATTCKGKFAASAYTVENVDFSDRTLLISQRNHGIHACGAARGDISRKRGNSQQQEGRGGDAQWILRCKSVEESC